MARHKEFDRDKALDAAIGVFCEHGYEGSSTDALLTAMKISRQSMYDTFGDKRSLYLQALERYNTDSILSIIADLKDSEHPLDALEAALLAFASRPFSEASRGCLGVSAICEFGRTDADVSNLTDSASAMLGKAIVVLLEDGQRKGQLSAEVDPEVATQFLGATLSGMKVSARNGASPETQRAVARLAIRSLR
ncbi:TetR/AcrR family transcriptional regulator [Rhizobium sp. T1470]|uniref:TetR/AcrR family transcriptional regulator n=1 Tax=unclassified Rhizobium TaxID=2613769 RepID=UPI001AB01218|nr:TetR/AcrR family transcriptional regulator [Rhizobium sp. T1473]MCA0803166.1 TetR/AcrR family transcriptional regulator [Rhizobium sp. T1473]